MTNKQPSCLKLIPDSAFVAMNTTVAPIMEIFCGKRLTLIRLLPDIISKSGLINLLNSFIASLLSEIPINKASFQSIL